MFPTIRPATEADSAAIPALMKGERVNPTGIDWRRFLVAEGEDGIVGCVQLRPAGLGAVEIGSLVVRPDLRAQGLGARLVEAAIAEARGKRILAVAPASRGSWWKDRGFRRIALTAAPWRVARNLLVGQSASLIALATRRRPRRLAILEMG